ncbi:hypothetical protein BDZ45DRAFT_679868 [Acephala macrosclerotiorum]|nr:hypothetical protein BDZ45DRAFT_679868 [Acephala macrosclerotiorum]
MHPRHFSSCKPLNKHRSGAPLFALGPAFSLLFSPLSSRIFSVAVAPLRCSNCGRRCASCEDQKLRTFGVYISELESCPKYIPNSVCGPRRYGRRERPRSISIGANLVTNTSFHSAGQSPLKEVLELPLIRDLTSTPTTGKGTKSEA